ncbi:MAG TPA: bifunctional phosphopantothenoylcysteine decarboxylase/phosphopantothenate--cysteine ligase CoaBC [Candidatus Limnocylindria bacterium]|nr:bifunctional phosphopantothenoylcysteine decarboxylase/phosphopantothenate--cysteine ligase CoaBC [Candidatus Limnocylindria bacterium]
MSRLESRRVALGVTGGIAAFKAIECLRLLTEEGADVRVLMTPEATRFIAPLTFEALSSHPVASDWLAGGRGGEAHIDLAGWAEVLAIVPATANTLAKLALGIADDVLTGTALATRAPLVVAPAMHDLMLSHPQTEAHLETLKEGGVYIVSPVVGRLASGRVAQGRLAAPERVVAVIRAVLSGAYNLEGCRVVITAGGTREPIDPVRFIGNASSGRMGRALATVAASRGAEVTLVTTMPADLEGITEVPVQTAAEMLAALQEATARAHILVMAAAVSDYRVEDPAPSKLKRAQGGRELRLTPNVDVLDSVGPRSGLFRVGFALETERLMENAKAKLAGHGLDLIVANQVGAGIGIGSEDNAVTILGPSGVVDEVPRAPKGEVAERIWDAITATRGRRT